VEIIPAGIISRGVPGPNGRLRAIRRMNPDQDRTDPMPVTAKRKRERLPLRAFRKQTQEAVR
jgi:hypothetical protein